MFLSNKEHTAVNHSRSKNISAPTIIGNQAYYNQTMPQKQCVQMYKLREYTYAKEPYDWDKQDKENLHNGYILALSKLETCLKEEALPSSIKDAVKNVKNVLMAEDLVIYPLHGDWLGQSAYGTNEISINIKKHYTPFGVGKTLVHEAFHIIGGCLDITKTPPKPLAGEVSCAHQVSKKMALETLGEGSIDKMSADHFAQFVMKSLDSPL